MKKNNFFIKGFVSLLVGFMVLNICIAQGNKARFIEPDRAKIIENRKDFLVKTQIDNYDTNANYWVAIATVKGHHRSWKRVLQLLTQGEDESQLVNLIRTWEIDQVWPKYFIKKKVYEGKVYDGGNNPRRDPQPMILLILKVDSKLDNDINQWFDEGSKKGWPGMNFEKIKTNLDVLARCEIFFP